ncbi:MAG: 2-amino-4-hydroxy-6-hydroxymethyldihydropteridine diphosphokinase, partial [Rikenellaceae bacterium]|nr:2-amino-4-hydroxy-6-hydroxymethyldihydropteridine diphosphokinase [Rikenellaceae bacterium]
LSADEVLDAVQAIERELGRDREEEARLKAQTGAHYSSRMIDIDVLFYDDLVLESPRLTIPHPLIEERDFVLAPLCELMKTKRHPVSGKTMEELRSELLAKRESEVIGNE